MHIRKAVTLSAAALVGVALVAWWSFDVQQWRSGRQYGDQNSDSRSRESDSHSGSADAPVSNIGPLPFQLESLVAEIADDSTSSERPEPTATDISPNPCWVTGASQQEFYHKLPGAGFIPDESEIDEDTFIARSKVKEAYGFSEWHQPAPGLIPGFKLTLADYSEFESFTVLMDQCHAHFTGDIAGHGVLREIELRRDYDKACISIRFVVALSVRAAQEKLIPFLRTSHEDVLHLNALRINCLSLGDVNSHSSFRSGEFRSIAFTRGNVYVQIEAYSMLADRSSVAGLDLLSLANKLDAAINAVDAVSREELAALRPRVTEFTIAAEVLEKRSEATNVGIMTWRVSQPRPGTLIVVADGTGDLQYDDRSNPTRIYGRVAGLQTARLVVIDDHLLFDWEDRTILVK